MTLKPGARLGPYEIVSPLGAGGMGEVYRARDTRLDRAVAVKVLPSHVSGHPEAKERFEREARAVSSLNHPNICTLHDVGCQDGVDYLVMEYLEGETLSDRLMKGPVPLDMALRIAVEIASALERAHRGGVVHRDLKPGNVILTKSGAKLLDFGLAKLREAQASPAAGLSTLRTEHKELTAEGTILGTFQYMAPEQLEGKEADARTDIFAFGALLYEMLTGRKAFAGKSQASLIASILAAEPPAMSTLQPLTPQALERVVTTCLAKDPDERWQTAHDLLLQLKWIAEGGSAAGLPAPVRARRRSRETIAWAVAAILGVACLALGIAALRPATATPGPGGVRFTVDPPEEARWRSFNSMAVSPDGRRIVYYADSKDGAGRLWIRSFSSLIAQPLPGTEFGNPSYPFWSPDSRFVGFFAGGKLKKIEVAGGPPITVCDARDGRGGTWNTEGTILFAPDTAGALYQVPAAGGEPKAVTTAAAGPQREAHQWPWFLPDGRHFTFLVKGAERAAQWVHVGSLDGGESRRLVGAESGAQFADPGYLLFAREGNLMAQPFDPRRMETTGDPTLAAERIGQSATGYAAFSVSRAGLMAYRAGGIVGKVLTWFDRAGRPTGTIGDPGEMGDPELSPDGKRVAVSLADNQGASSDIWLAEMGRGTLSRFTFSPGDDFNPVWSPDGAWIYYSSFRENRRTDIYRKSSRGAGDEEPVLTAETHSYADHISPDGALLLYETESPETQVDLWVVPLSGERNPRPFLKTRFNEGQARFSPDGKWVAYTSDESGQTQVYVQSFPGPGGKWQISTAGGAQPQWRRDGKEIFYLDGASRLAAVPLKIERASIEPGLPAALFDTGLTLLLTRNHYTVAADGQRILVGIRSGGAATLAINVTLGWAEALKR